MKNKLNHHKTPNVMKNTYLCFTYGLFILALFLHFMKSSVSKVKDRLLKPYKTQIEERKPVYYTTGNYWVYLPEETLEKKAIRIQGGKTQKTFLLNKVVSLVDGKEVTKFEMK